MEDAFSGLKSFFNQNDLNDPRVNSAIRQRIAIEMMKKQPYPKTIGEGLSAIGNSIGDIGMANRLARADLAAQDAGAKLYDQGQKPTAEPPQATSQASPSVFNTGTTAVAGLPPVVARDDSEEDTPAATVATPQSPVGPSAAEATAANSLVNPQRSAIATALMNRAAGGPQPNPILAGDDQVVSQLPIPNTPASTPTVDSDAVRIASTDPGSIVLPNVRPAPPAPVQMAQAQINPPARYDYVMPKPGAAPSPAQTEKTPQEMNLERMIINNQGNPYAVQGLERLRKDLEDKRLYIDKQNAERYQNQLLLEREMEMKRQEQLQNRAKAATEGTIQEQGVIRPIPAAPVPGAVDNRLGTIYSPQRTGIPSPPPLPPGSSPAEHQRLYAPVLAQAAQAADKATPEFQRSIDLLNELAQHPGKEWALGATGNIAGKIPGTAAFGFRQRVEQLAGKTFLQAYQILKGGGSITEIEGTKATQALARLNAANNKEEFDAATNDLEKTLRSDMELLQRKVNRPVTAWHHADDPTDYAPDIGERGTRKGKPVEYIGGDPHVDSSYRLVR